MERLRTPEKGKCEKLWTLPIARFIRRFGLVSIKRKRDVVINHIPFVVSVRTSFCRTVCVSRQWVGRETARLNGKASSDVENACFAFK